MARKFSGGALIIASHNQGKVREIGLLLAPFGAAVTSAAERGLAEPEETGTTFIDNAILKAKAATIATGVPALADDSGLGADALGGAPGIYSARWAGPEKDFGAAMEKLQIELGASENRGAAFVSALALAWPDGHVETTEGRVQGTLVWPPRGDRGFGYDPMFVPDGGAQTFGEMEASAKEAVSHRTLAFEKLVAMCFKRA
ncbi:MAG: RdgB/HAM1 family non-canonical purine NTP pyrophosphatase [Rhodospirillaceae bacterium]|jgi:XTP/dITP diphosphohydrolase|nr:RdgB/HAM1 family non-canonical purine NTP pyrophosphatase [Rhodospirillaceae bacterium]MBT3884980.1 RdgB/HAM1 family non-canonical purine NTP pyrophosphatase [Rhodospirillaceae bacterium]MBT4118264.1 RdgB/HAM1 family non-canonical purine NTP pyrophosphatase [Rhodospirillaceae bacterium]MBT4673107.1 RdgB/HAM1 family non-canonical purine NTP pyrophosphatase [Rhodospirillaceae bacterium]MBT4721928.1 RdgB/HAM1 family non-canonical purine NTP pyrophosphatase [Rhodospirillaceae bacterium]